MFVRSWCGAPSQDAHETRHDTPAGAAARPPPRIHTLPQSIPAAAAASRLAVERHAEGLHRDEAVRVERLRALVGVIDGGRVEIEARAGEDVGDLLLGGRREEVGLRDAAVGEARRVEQLPRARLVPIVLVVGDGLERGRCRLRSL